jgi:TonB family protein
MEQLVNYLVESSLALAVFYLAYRWFFAADRNFGFNRIYLILSSALALAIPLLSLAILPGNSGNTASLLQAIRLDEVAATGAATSAWPVPKFMAVAVPVVYFSGLVFFLLRFLIHLFRLLHFIRQQSSAAENLDRYTLIPTGGRFETCSFFSYLLWNETTELDETEKQQIRLHEEAHIRQWHSFDVLYFQILSIVFWFNPLFRAYQQAIGEVHEYLADASASCLEGPRNYLRLLAAQTVRPYGFSLNNHFQQSKMLRRMKMLKQSKKRPVILNGFLALGLAVTLTMALACEPNDTKQANLPEQVSEKIDEVFTQVEVMPEPAGGLQAFMLHIANTIRYPEGAKAAGESGKVFVEFVVGADGKISNVKALQGIGYGCDEEAVRAVSASPDWKPGTVNGEPVAVRLVLPVTFALESQTQSKE